MRSTGAATRSRCCAFAVCIALVAAGCVGPEEAVDLGREFPDTTKMGEIQASGVIRIALPEEGLPLAADVGGSAKGIAADLGDYIASTLGVMAERVPAPADTVLSMVEAPADPEADPEVDIAFTNVPLTEEVVRENSFTNPYFIAHQRLLVHPDAGIENVSQLGGRRVCSYLSPDTGVDVSLLVDDVEIVEADDPAFCGSLLDSGRVDAITAATDALVNVAKRLEHEEGDGPYEVVGDELNTQGYSIATVPGAPSFVTYLNSVLRRAETDGVMERIYDRWLSPYLEQQEPPQLSLEESATLYPTTQR